MMYSYKAGHTLYFFVHLLIMYGFPTTHFIVIFIVMCNINLLINN